MAYDNTNRGSAWKKEKKSDKSPSYSGILNVNGLDYEIAIWKGAGDGSGKGKPDITMQIKTKGERSQQSAPVIDVFDDSLPF